MKKAKKAAVVSILVLSAMFSQPGVSHALKPEATCWTDPGTPHTLWRKAGRGVTNLGLGWLELVYQPYYLRAEGNQIPVALVGGVFKGLFYGITRTLVGAYETLTFPVPVPENYEPIMHPEIAIPGYCAAQQIERSL